ncbi:MAG: hypothetical protein ACP5KN_18695, partial [Armatimonadota bacterium]
RVMSKAFEAAYGRAEGHVDAMTLAEEVDAALESVAGAMTSIERNKPHYLVPSCMRDMSVLHEYLGLLAEQLREVADGSRDWREIDWYIEQNIAQRER